ncbi:MAG: flavodoxin family protein [Oscillospiraceae bacterium]|nr:flavodoxin family protein [Oscillospiraceae bacterium]
MKVLAINGSPHKDNTTYTAIGLVTAVLEKEGIETEVIQIGDKGVHGCIGCGKCRDLGKCIFNDGVNECAEKLRAADGLILAAPTYYGGIAGDAKCFFDRLFYTGRHAMGKPAAAVTVARRSGGEGVISQLNNYLMLSGTIIVPTNYWNYIHGHTGSEALQDTEGIQILETVGRSMAWLLKCLDATKDSIPMPQLNKSVATNFIR